MYYLLTVRVRGLSIAVYLAVLLVVVEIGPDGRDFGLRRDTLRLQHLDVERRARAPAAAAASEDGEGERLEDAEGAQRGPKAHDPDARDGKHGQRGFCGR